ncbi:unnamed protein product [Cylicocyclus nassatus]|uniref:Insulin-like domain-containing protein n=1 Tax=Cylicocyclus nassatus TaxID=53992 RepID=A0AA36DLH4_CYLNA|nr:unnamed protein product [Cylicocyclus nassatus]
MANSLNRGNDSICLSYQFSTKPMFTSRYDLAQVLQQINSGANADDTDRYHSNCCLTQPGGYENTKKLRISLAIPLPLERMSPSRSFIVILCILTTGTIASRLCGVTLVHKLGKMCKITTEESCSDLDYKDVNIPIMDVAERCCSQQCSLRFLQSVCCALNFGSSHHHRKVAFSTKDLYETLQ